MEMSCQRHSRLNKFKKKKKVRKNTCVARNRAENANGYRSGKAEMGRDDTDVCAILISVGKKKPHTRVCLSRRAVGT